MFEERARSSDTHAHTHTHIRTQRYIVMAKNTSWLALFNLLSGGARVTTTASWKDNHTRIAQAFPRGRGRSEGAEKKKGRECWTKKEGSSEPVRKDFMEA